jgi:hypothetical protein
MDKNRAIWLVVGLLVVILTLATDENSRAWAALCGSIGAVAAVLGGLYLLLGWLANGGKWGS